MKQYFDLTGQVAIVTGASTGLGVQMAKATKETGGKVLVSGHGLTMANQVMMDLLHLLHKKIT